MVGATHIHDPRVWMFSDPETDWSTHNYNRHQQQAIEYVEPVYDDLPTGAVDAIATAVEGTRRCQWLERIERLDPQTVELVYYGDNGETEVDHRVLPAVRDAIQRLFGVLWRVGRKRDERYRDNESPQRLVVRRVSAFRFTYRDEAETTYQHRLHGTPDGVPDHAYRWAALDQYGLPAPVDGVWQNADIYTHTTDTGTQHLVPARRSDGEGLVEARVTDGTTTHCGHTIDRETLAAGDPTHYRHLLADHVETAYLQVDQEVITGCSTADHSSLAKHMDLSLDPQSVLDDLCGSCWRAYSKPEYVHEAGECRVVGRVPPVQDRVYQQLLTDEGEP